MSKQQINMDQVERLRASLSEAPPKPKDGYMVREVVGELAPLLLDMRKKGHNLVDIAAYFVQHDIIVSASTLGSYLRDHDRKGSTQKERPQNARRRSAKAAPVPLVAEPEAQALPPG
ncbi:hypothetical protein SAMN04489859_105813 [Paracoccus alcaliphilus]|uniref:Uncharacterized protein n=1 Tax=Paracoccus alcaliphilus TaxID=34002 RepID=A0A1H8NF01_9RHOB|nr:hypothetical protein [Paracoccus alcaliphilus]WCR18754.1 hypothetical protein JHW40_03280 [Paracoccus alcaliphilus]SEO28048.1 hypothetical protein SAMN04489859_105813 [Paracoccus alcaliphilus]